MLIGNIKSSIQTIGPAVVRDLIRAHFATEYPDLNARSLTHHTFLTLTHHTFRWDVCSVEIDICTVVRTTYVNAGWPVPRVRCRDARPIASRAVDPCSVCTYILYIPTPRDFKPYQR